MTSGLNAALEQRDEDERKLKEAEGELLRLRGAPLPASDYYDTEPPLTRSAARELVLERKLGAAEHELDRLRFAAGALLAESVGPHDPPQAGSNLERLYRLVTADVASPPDPRELFLDLIAEVFAKVDELHPTSWGNLPKHVAEAAKGLRNAP